MLLRKPLPLWITVSLFAVAVTTMPLASRWLRRPVSSLHTLAELTARLSRSTPPLYVVPQFPDQPESWRWVCDRPQSREQLGRLVRHPDRVKTGHWRGIVFCERVGETSGMTDDFIHDNWGECGMRIGPFLLFGDPDLLQRIGAVILAN
jgi:hypothetical protein